MDGISTGKLTLGGRKRFKSTTIRESISFDLWMKYNILSSMNSSENKLYKAGFNGKTNIARESG